MNQPYNPYIGKFNREFQGLAKNFPDGTEINLYLNPEQWQMVKERIMLLWDLTKLVDDPECTKGICCPK